MGRFVFEWTALFFGAEAARQRRQSACKDPHIELYKGDLWGAPKRDLYKELSKNSTSEGRLYGVALQGPLRGRWSMRIGSSTRELYNIISKGARKGAPRRELDMVIGPRGGLGGLSIMALSWVKGTRREPRECESVREGGNWYSIV